MLTISKRIDQLLVDPFPTNDGDIFPVVPFGTTVANQVSALTLKTYMLNNSAQVFKQTYSGTTLQNINTTPIVLLPPLAPTKAYAIIPNTAFYKIVIGTTPYNFPGAINIGDALGTASPAASISQAQINGSTAIIQQFLAGITNLTDNLGGLPLLLYSVLGNATVGDNQITIGFDYRIVDMS